MLGYVRYAVTALGLTIMLFGEVLFSDWLFDLVGIGGLMKWIPIVLVTAYALYIFKLTLKDVADRVL